MLGLIPYIVMKQKLRSFIFLCVTSFILWLGVYSSMLVYQVWGVLEVGPLWWSIQALSVFFPLLIALSVFIGGKKWSILNALVFRVASPWNAYVAGLFMSTYLAAMVNIFLPEISSVLFAWTAFVFSIIFVVYGVVNANYARTRHMTILANELLEPFRGKKIVLISDLHIGLVRGRRFVERAVARIMEENGDLIVIAGDLIDGPIFPYEKYLRPLHDLRAPLGVYYTPGNHEQYNSENKKFYATIPSNIKILKDKVAHIDGGLGHIAGIDYRNETDTVFAQKAKQILGDYQPAITILHDPKHRKQLDGKTGLVLSGHTHGGQMFPGTLLVRFLYGRKMKGLVESVATIFYTTVGIGTSLVPARVGTRPEVVVIHIN